MFWLLQANAKFSKFYTDTRGKSSLHGSTITGFAVSAAPPLVELIPPHVLVPAEWMN